MLINKNFKKLDAGFTLIELLVVVAIVSLMSSIVLSSLNTARAKARDARTMSQFKEIQKGMALYFDKYGKYPNETAVGPPWTDNFISMAQQLVAEGFLPSVPVSPSANTAYYYYNYSSDPILGALLVTNLEAYPATSVGYPGTCRYTWAGGNVNWCNNNIALPSTYYCICNPK